MSDPFSPPAWLSGWLSTRRPVCPRCGSARIVRDACARWDTNFGRWVLAQLHDRDFCETCEADIDDPLAWVPLDQSQERPPIDQEGSR